MAINGIGRLGPKNGAPAVPKLQVIARNGQAMNRLTTAEALATLAGRPNELLTLIDQELASPSARACRFRTAQSRFRQNSPTGRISPKLTQPCFLANADFGRLLQFARALERRGL
jgi:hypothetical protein